MTATWKTVRVFISSTFRDMQAERDHLVRFVFPKLRQELLQRRIHLVDVDLRWGVTSEQDALSVCREVVDECRPRFLCMLGGRYGWVPPSKTRSITADEVHYGVLDRDLTSRGFAYFYFRDPSATAAMVEVAPGEFIEPAGSHGAVALDELKTAIVESGLQPFIYRAQWDDQSRRLIGLKEFGYRVYADLKQSIDQEFGPTTGETPDEFTEENAAMEAFIEERTERYVVGSRQAILDQLGDFVETGSGSNVLVLTGAAGSGKSALLSNFSQVCQTTRFFPIYETPVMYAPRPIVISHFVGASVGSTDVRRTLRRLCHELATRAEITVDIPEDPEKLRVAFAELLQQACAQRLVLILLDGVNQFDDTPQMPGLTWLPDRLPQKARLFLTTLPGTAHEALKRRRPPPYEIELKPLTPTDGAAIITGFLHRYRKNLSPEQRTALLAKADAGTPLYLLVALEELRTLGTYEEITDRIAQLPPDTRALFIWILKRLEEDDGFRDASGRKIGRELVSHFVSLLGASRHGLSQQELVELLSPGDPQGNVAALAQLLRPYLMQRGELLDFYHGQFRKAVEDEYLEREPERVAAHARLAAYFRDLADPEKDRFWDGDSRRGFLELPFHLIRAGMWEGVETTLTDLAFVDATCRVVVQVREHTDRDLAVKSSAELQYLVSEGAVAIQDYYDFALGEFTVRLPEHVRAQYPHCEKLLSAFRMALIRQAHVIFSDPNAAFAQLYPTLMETDWTPLRSSLTDSRLRMRRPQLLARSWPKWRTGVIRTLRGLEHVVGCMAWSPDGGRLAACPERMEGSMYYGVDSSTCVWNVRTGEHHCIEEHLSLGADLLFAWGDHVLAICTWQYLQISLLEWTGQPLRTLFDNSELEEEQPEDEEAAGIHAVCFGGDRLFHSSFDDHRVRFWTLHPSLPFVFSERSTVMEFPEPVQCVDTDRRGDIVAAAAGRQVRAVRVGQNEPLLATNMGSNVSAVRCSPDGSQLCVATQDESVVYRLDNDMFHPSCHISGDTEPLCFSPDGRLLASTSALWDPTTGNQVVSFEGKSIGHLRFSPDGTQVAVALRGSQHVALWNCEALLNGLTAIPDVPSAANKAIDESRVLLQIDSDLAITGSADGTMDVYRFCPPGKLTAQVGGAIKAAAHQGESVAISIQSEDIRVALFELALDGTLLQRWTNLVNVGSNPTTHSIMSATDISRHQLVLSPDGRYLVLKLFPSNAEKSVAMHFLSSVDGREAAVCYRRGKVELSPDGVWACHTDHYGEGCILVHMTDGLVVGDIGYAVERSLALSRRQDVSCAAFSKSGQFLTLGYDSGGIGLVDMRSLWCEMEAAEVESHGQLTSNDHRPWCLEDGINDALSGPRWRSFRILRQCAVRRGLERAVTALAFSPGDRYLAVALGGEGKVEVWDLNGRKQLAACHFAGPVRHMAFGKGGSVLRLGVASDPVLVTCDLVNVAPDGECQMPTVARWAPTLCQRALVPASSVEFALLPPFALMALFSMCGAFVSSKGWHWCTVLATAGVFLTGFWALMVGLLRRKRMMPVGCPVCGTMNMLQLGIWSVCRSCSVRYLVTVCESCHGRIAAVRRGAKGECPHCGTFLALS